MTYLATTLFISTRERIKQALAQFRQRLEICSVWAEIHFTSTDPEQVTRREMLANLLQQREYEKPDEDLSNYNLYAFYTVYTPKSEHDTDQATESLIMDDDNTEIDQLPSAVDIIGLTGTPCRRNSGGD